MKKIFTLSMMAAAVLGMSAATLQRQGELKAPTMPTAKTISGAQAIRMPVASKPMAKKTGLKAPSTEEDVIGAWTLTALSMTSGSAEEFEVQIEPSQNAGKIAISNFLGCSVEATFDADNGEIHIPFQTIGYSQEYSEDVNIANTYVSEQGTVTIDKADIILYLDGDNFTFDNPIGLWGEEISANTSYGAWQYGVMTPGSNWENLGEATYNDFLCNFFLNFGDATDVPTSSKVQAQRSLVDPGVYRLRAPYYDWIGSAQDMEIWIDDPKCVVFPLQMFGTFSDGAGSSISIAWASVSGVMGVYQEDGPTVDEFINGEYGYANITFDTEKKLINVGTPATAKTSDIVVTYPSQWTETDQPLYFADNQNGSRPNGSIQFSVSAINSIMAANPDAPVEYFNMMGQRVLNPTAGQLVIRRQGNEATKIVF